MINSCLKAIVTSCHKSMSQSHSAFTSYLMLTVLFMMTASVNANVYDAPTPHIPIPLLDENEVHVLESGKPYSTRKSCGGCHDYEGMTHAFHIDQGRGETSDDFGEKRGLPQLVGPGYYGGFNCMGASNPTNLAKKSNASPGDFADYGSAGIIKRCTTCHAGGGWMEKDRKGRRYDETDPATVTELDGDYFNRGTDEYNNPADISVVSQWDWRKSGVVENDCLLCHLDLTRFKRFDQSLELEPGRHDPPFPITDPVALAGKLRAEMAGRGLFRYVNTAILEYFNLNTTVDPALDTALVAFSRTDSDDDNTTVDNNELDIVDGLPVIQWSANAFDQNRKVSLPMLRFAANDNCMGCHRTSNSRRGFYGFGEDAEAVYVEDDGTLVEDYRDDVHKGKTWTEGEESRTIENCNVCHAREYFKPASDNVSIDASHNFLRGNSDMDVRNDLDFNPNAKSCEYCHDDAPNSDIANPNGYADMLSAHENLWKLGGDMAGYPQDSLTRITQTHLDVITCQACHITDKSIISHGHEVPLIPMYRYREAEDGKLRIVPYKPSTRSYWQDKNSGRVLNNFETMAVTANTIPGNYDEFVALKNAYDQLLAEKGVINPDVAMVIAEINQYLISHNTSPAVSSVQCEDCHNKKSDGSFSSLVSSDGLLGEGHSKVVTSVADPRLVDEGMIIFNMPYMKMDAAGKVTENVADILSYSLVDPSMTALKSATTDIATGMMQEMPLSDAIEIAHFADDDVQTLSTLISADKVYFYQSGYGNPVLRDITMMVESNPQTERVFPGCTMQVALADDDVVADAAAAGMGGIVSKVFSLEAIDPTGAPVASFSPRQMLVKLPYNGSSSDPDEINIITASDGAAWTEVASDQIRIIRPQTTTANGYVVFLTDHFSNYAVTDTTAAASISTDTASGSGGGGSINLLLLLLGLIAAGCSRVPGKWRQEIR